MSIVLLQGGGLSPQQLNQVPLGKNALSRALAWGLARLSPRRRRTLTHD